MVTDEKMLIGCEVEIVWDSGEYEKILISEKGDGSAVAYDSAFSRSLVGVAIGETVRYHVNGNVVSYRLVGIVNREIERCIVERNLSKIYHFTSLENLHSIMEHGILSRQKLEEQGIPFSFNDSERLEQRRNYISCSLEYPNNRLLWKFHFKHEERFCILEIDIDVIKKDMLALCCFMNAAKRRGDLVRPISELETLFGGERDAALPRNFPTNEQAEILVYEHIPIKYIRRVVFENEYRRKQYVAAIPSGIETLVDSELFCTRKE